LERGVKKKAESPSKKKKNFVWQGGKLGRLRIHLRFGEH